MKFASNISPNMCRPAWVVFSGDTELPWLKILKPGFRHCFVLLHDEAKGWIGLDPLSTYLRIDVPDLEPDTDLPSVFKAQGYIVLKTYVQQRQSIAPVELVNCVSIVKRILGLHNRFVTTPWQLFKAIEKRNHKFFNHQMLEAKDWKADVMLKTHRPLNSAFYHSQQKGDMSWEV